LGRTFPFGSFCRLGISSLPPVGGFASSSESSSLNQPLMVSTTPLSSSPPEAGAA
jgi:hypothetical protein